MDCIKNTTILSRKQYVAFYWFTFRRSSGFFVVLLPVVLLFAGWMFLFSKNENLLIAFTATAVFICLYGGWLFLTPFRAFDRMKQLENVFTFYPDELEIESQKPEATGVSRYRYEGFDRIFERQDSFYFYVDKRRAFLLSKEGFTQGTPEELSRFLSGKVGNKLKRVPGVGQ